MIRYYSSPGLRGWRHRRRYNRHRQQVVLDEAIELRAGVLEQPDGIGLLVVIEHGVVLDGQRRTAITAVAGDSVEMSPDSYPRSWIYEFSITPAGIWTPVEVCQISSLLTTVPAESA